jgi:hypothetical protein
MIGLLLSMSPAIVGRVRSAIVDSRQQARQGASRRLVAELHEAGVDIAPRAMSIGRPLDLAAGLARRHEDEVLAEMAAQSLTAQWRGVALYEAQTGKPISGTVKRMASRVERTAASEVAHAYNDEHRRALDDAIQYDDVLGSEIAGALIVREWSAIADACRFCWPHDGEQTEIGGSFSDGAEPGLMHPRCRCVELLVSAQRAANTNAA